VIRTNIAQNSQTETYGNTVLLAYRATNKKLIATREIYQSFDLTNKSFLVGKIKEHVDGIINDDMISRIHAEIKSENGKYYLTDLNSTNGTFHNGRRLEANETVEIKEEDIICFATAEYIFR
jgi:pSer/pThr/pTyr-binding forkhead associated (FHA) protein